MSENIDRRVLAGFRCVDALTNLTILSPLTVATNQLALNRNYSGIFAVMDAPGLTASTTQFIPTPASSWPTPQTFEITIQDPQLRYLSRRANIAAPQPLPVVAAPATTPAGGPPQPPPVTTPQDIVMYPTPAAPVAPNWAVVRATVVSNANPPVPLPWAVVQVTGIATPPRAGLTNQNGEALLAVAGLGLTLSSAAGGTVTEATTPATVTAWFNPATLSQPKGWVANPDDILLNLSNAQLKSASQSVQLGPGQTVFITIAISV